MIWEKKNLLAAFFVLALVASLYAQTRLADPGSMNVSAGWGQAEIIFNAENADRDIVIWINGTIAAHVPPKSKAKIIVQNGENIVEAADSTVNRGQWKIGNKKKITVLSFSDCTTIGMTTRFGALLNLNIQNTTILDLSGTGSAPSPSVPQAVVQSPAVPPPVAAPVRIMGGSMDSAIASVTEMLINDLPAKATVAVLNISTSDPATANFIIDEMVYLLVISKKFTVVDRGSLDTLRQEQQFQYSGEVDDNSATSLGKLLGASIVITGNVTQMNYGRRLFVKALDVQTAGIKAMSRSDF